MNFESCQLILTLNSSLSEANTTCLWTGTPLDDSINTLHFDFRSSTLKLNSASISLGKKKLNCKFFQSNLLPDVQTKAPDSALKKNQTKSTKNQRNNNNNNNNTKKKGNDSKPATEITSTNLLTLKVSESLQRGQKYTLSFSYQARVRSDGFGLYKCQPLSSSKKNEHGFLMTHFEPVFCPLLFPFPNPQNSPDNQDDHQSFLRVAYQLQVELLNSFPDHDVIANMPLVERIEQSDKISFLFEPTPPLPPYLFAFSIGQFQTENLSFQSKIKSEATPIRILLPEGIYDSSFGSQIVSTLKSATILCLDSLESFFKIPLPCEKLDILITPYMVLTGMENYAFCFLNVRQAEGIESCTAKVQNDLLHELIHQWIGDYIGMSLFFKEGLVQYVEVLLREKLFKSSKQKREKSSTNKNLSSVGFISTSSDPESQIYANEFLEKQNESLYEQALKELGALINQLKEEQFVSFLQEACRQFPWGFLSNEQVTALMKAQRED